ncbi:MAG: HypC/HybG/HupF family hydrogenase formation chaperone [Candidatus Marinimicrobia bacterium]|nr:HypC/HybG/HupF family hydrogenase formation chaperone [Candidatus Neomarinimicrobiota bacterium]MBL7023307.1 HypC/HybG/HupF family hydrogenase formation chaperone [Candidatus Neomarinimicrobiota bacterium]
MCLAIPGKVIEIYDENGLKMGKIDYAGTINKACLEYTPEAQVGEYCIVHAGFAISVLNEEEAGKTFQEWDRMLEEINKEISSEEK